MKSPTDICATAANARGLLAQQANATVIDALEAPGIARCDAMAKRMTSCMSGGLASVQILKPTSAKWIPNHCDQRLCSHTSCHRHRVRLTWERLTTILSTYRHEAEGYLPPSQRLRFVTLTMRRQPGGPRDAYNRASQALLKLRKRKAWNYHMGQHEGGAMASYEAEWADGGYNPHWHMAQGGGRFWTSNCRQCWRHHRPNCRECREVDRKCRARGVTSSIPRWYPTCGALYSGTSRFATWPRTGPCDGGAYKTRPADHEPAYNCDLCRCLSCEWAQCTDDGSYVVDMRRVDDPAAELVKYITKVACLPADQLVLWATTMRRIRRFRWLGSWEGRGLPDKVAAPVVQLTPSQLYELATSEAQFKQFHTHARPSDFTEVESKALQLDWFGADVAPDQLAVVGVVLDSSWALAAYKALERSVTAWSDHTSKRDADSIERLVPF